MGRRLAALVLLVACGGPSSPPPGGGAARPLAVEPAAYSREAMSITTLTDGAPVDLSFPPQGGLVIFVAPMVRDLDDPVVELRGRLRDADTDEIVVQDRRTVSLVRAPGDDGLWIPDLRSFTNVSHLTTCPSATTVDRVDRSWVVEMEVVELASGRIGAGRHTVVPSCRQDDPARREQCECLCAAGFEPGKCGPTPR